MISVTQIVAFHRIDRRAERKTRLNWQMTKTLTTLAIKERFNKYLLDPTNYPLEIVGNRIIEQFATSIHKTGD
jgi:hypothetical protein